MRKIAYLGAVFMAGGVVACGSAGRTAAWEKTPAAPAAGTKTSTSATAPLMAEAKGHWDKRDDKAELKSAIESWNKVVAVDAANAEAQTWLARANYFLADGFLNVEDAPVDEQFAVYQAGVDAAEKALLAIDANFEKQMRGGAKFEDAISTIEKPAATAAYWYAANLARFASKKGLSARLFYKDKLRATMERVAALDPAIFYGGADRFLGGYFAALPGIAGRDLDRSAKHFEKSLAASPDYLGTKIVQAQFLAVAKDDEDMYKKLLDEVIAADAAKMAEVGPENRAAQRTAKKMLAEIDEVF